MVHTELMTDTFIFDADNIVGKDFTRAMNNEFCKGYRVVTGYRNS